MKRSAICRIEQAEYSGWSFMTLFRVANARLRITLESAEDEIKEYRKMEEIGKNINEQCAKLREMSGIGYTTFCAPEALGDVALEEDTEKKCIYFLGNDKLTIIPVDCYTCIELEEAQKAFRITL